MTITQGGVPLLAVDLSKISQQVTPLSYLCHTPEMIIAPYETPEGKVYTPKAGFTGEDNFWYVIIDAQGRTNSAQVKINVTQ